jgi:hypothetical protein
MKCISPAVFTWVDNGEDFMGFIIETPAKWVLVAETETTIEEGEHLSVKERIGRAEREGYLGVEETTKFIKRILEADPDVSQDEVETHRSE